MYLDLWYVGLHLCFRLRPLMFGVKELTAAVVYILITPTSLPRILDQVSWTQVHHSKEAHVTGVITFMFALREV